MVSDASTPIVMFLPIEVFTEDAYSLKAIQRVQPTRALACEDQVLLSMVSDASTSTVMVVPIKASQRMHTVLESIQLCATLSAACL